MFKIIKILIAVIYISNTHIAYPADNPVVSLSLTLRPVATKDFAVNKGLLDSLNEYNRFIPDVVVSLKGNNLRANLADFYNSSAIVLEKDIFPDGEIRIVISNPQQVQGKSVLLVHDVKEDSHFVELLLQIAALRDSGAGQIACLFPEAILESSIILDAISPFTMIYTAEDSLFKEQQADLSAAKFIAYQPVLTGSYFERKRQFDYILFTEKNRLKDDVIAGLGRFNENEKLDTGTIKVNTFDSGSVSADVPADVSGKDCLLIHSTRTSKSIVELLAILEALKRQGAKDIHVLFFFFAYDRQEKNFPAPEYGPDALSANAAKMLLSIISQYCSRIYTVNTHFIKEPRINVFRFEGAESLEIVNLNALPYLMQYFRHQYKLNNAVIVAPDEGVAAFLSLLAKTWQQELYVFQKKRTSVKDVEFIEPEEMDIQGRDVIILDDVISGGSTIIKLARLLKDRYNAGDIYVGTVHGKQAETALAAFLSAADAKAKPLIKDIISTDTIVSQTSKVSVSELIVEFLREHQVKAGIITDEEAGKPAITLILPYRLAGADDVVFMVNTARKLKQLYPGMPVKVIFFKEDDYMFLDRIKLLSGFKSNKNIQRLYGITYINAMGSVKMLNEFVGRNDLAIIYAIYPDEYIGSQIDYFEKFAPDAALRIRIHELGRELRWQEPNKNGDYLLGFNENSIGIPPAAPNFESYVRYHREKDNSDIYRERVKVIRKIPGYDILDIDDIARSQWGFVYAHTPHSLEMYFKSFLQARRKSLNFASQETTIFINHSEGNASFRNETIRIAGEYGFKLFEYSRKDGTLKMAMDGKSNVTLIINTSVPRKLFGQLFALSNDLPSLITGQDNLSNIICVNALTKGRAFFWEVLIFQYTAEYELQRAAENILNAQEYEIFKETMKPGQQVDYDLLAGLFIEHDKHRGAYHKLAAGLSKEFDFADRISYIINKQWPEKIEYSRRFKAVKDGTGIDARPGSENLKALTRELVAIITDNIASRAGEPGRELKIERELKPQYLEIIEQHREDSVFIKLMLSAMEELLETDKIKKDKVVHEFVLLLLDALQPAASSSAGKIIDISFKNLADNIMSDKRAYILIAESA
jgi:ribose-phosphate pyrophosphokinase